MHGTCPTGKKRYATSRAAFCIVSAAKWKGNNKRRDKKPKRAYYCSACQGYHLAHTKIGMYDRKKKRGDGL